MSDFSPSPPRALPRAVIFDLDGTLIDSWASTLRFFNTIRHGVGLAEMNPAEEEFVFSASIAQGLEHIIPPELRDKAEQIRAGIDFRDLTPFVRAMPGAAELLAWLKAAGVGLGVNTNSGHETGLLLESVGLAGFFETVVTADDVARPKPDPEGALRLLERLEVPASSCVYIGDSLLDLGAARSAGLTFWAYAQPGLEAHWLVESYPALLDFLKSLSAQR